MDMLLPVLLTVLLIASIVVGGTRLAHTSDDFQFWALAVNLVWATFYLWLITGVCWSAMRRKEMRASYRFPARLDLSVIVRQAETKTAIDGYARNLNRFGLSVTNDKGLPIGSTVEIELRIPNHTIRAAGEVMRHRAYRVQGVTRIANGIRFTRIDLKDQDEISKYLFWQIAPREHASMQLTNATQREA